MTYVQLLLFVCPLIFLAGFVDSVAGGGGIISIPVYIFAGLPVHNAYGINKFSSAIGTTVSAGRFLMNKALDVKVSAISAIGSFIGAGIGAHIVLMLSDETLKKSLLVVLPIAAIIILSKKNYGDENLSGTLSAKKSALLAMIIGVLIGAYDGIFGPGTGTFAIMAYAMIMKYDLKTASGNAKVLNLASGYSSLITYMIAGKVIFSIAIPAAVCGILGNYLGAGFAIKKGAKFIRPMMVFVIVMIILKMALEVIM